MTLDEMNGFDKLEKVVKAKKYLADTDYVVTKLAEASAFGEDTSMLRSKYAEVIAKRREARVLISSLES